MWIRQPTSNAPLARCAHAADSIDGKLYVFGGWSEAKVFNDLHVYDPETQMWTKLQDDKIDPNILTCRSGHSATAVGKKLLIFGGGSVNETGSLFLNDILIFDTESSRWQMAYACGPTPAGRTKHTATLIGSKLYVFGGGDGLRLFNDIFCLDIETMTWSVPSCKGTPPCPRWGHSMVQAGSQLVIFGGHDGLNRLGDVNVFDTNTMTWRQEMCSRRSPPEVASPCAGHTATMVGPHMLLWGGGDGRVLTDMYALDTRTWQWWWAGNAPGTCAHTTTLVGNLLMAFGGGDGVSCFNDLYTFDVGDELGTLFQAKPNLKVVSPSKHAPVNAPPLSISPPKAPRSTSRPPSNKFSSAGSSPPSGHTIPPTASSNHTTSRNTPPPTNQAPNHTIPNHVSNNSSIHNTIPPVNTHLSNHVNSTSPNFPPSVSPILPQELPHVPLPSFSDTGYDNVNGANNRGSHRENPGSRRNSASSKSNFSAPSPIPTTPPISPRESPQLNASGGIGPNITNNGNRSRPASPRESPQLNSGNNNGNRSRRNSRPPQSIAKWLQSLGMSKYLDRFVAEEIDVDILDMVTENHFKLLGIPLGDRLRLCAAINKFSGRVEL